jgi:hypothetical protein
VAQTWPPFSFLFITGEHLKLTTRLSASIRSSPVAGFLPRRLPFSWMQNFPKPVTRTSSPPSRVFLMISKVASTALAEAVLERSRRSKTERVMAPFVRVMMAGFLYWLRMGPSGHRDVEEYASDPGSESTGRVYHLEIQWLLGCSLILMSQVAKRGASLRTYQAIRNKGWIFYGLR